MHEMVLRSQNGEEKSEILNRHFHYCHFHIYIVRRRTNDSLAIGMKYKQTKMNQKRQSTNGFKFLNKDE